MGLDNEEHFKMLYKKESKAHSLTKQALKNTQEELRGKNKTIRETKYKINKAFKELQEL